ncbi:MAG: TolC family protein [Betaproteobacteria bacterium]|nr:TolC family protein [Betaproteobacteria bacterium]
MFRRFAAGAPSVRLSAAVALMLYGLAAIAAPLTLEEAWRIAEQANPALRTAQAAVHAARGQLAEARAPLFNNPAISASALKEGEIGIVELLLVNR